jgi:hypothetical protein
MLKSPFGRVQREQNDSYFKHPGLKISGRGAETRAETRHSSRRVRKSDGGR